MTTSAAKPAGTNGAAAAVNSATASEQLAEYAHDAVNRVADAAAAAESRLRVATTDAEKALKLKSGELKSRASDTLSKAESVAREKPFLVAGAALATGYLLGKVLGR